MLTKDQILSRKRTLKKHHVESLGGDVFIRQLSIREAGEYQEAIGREGITSREIVALMVSYALSDADGERMLTADEALDLTSEELEEIADIITSTKDDAEAIAKK